MGMGTGMGTITGYGTRVNDAGTSNGTTLRSPPNAWQGLALPPLSSADEQQQQEQQPPAGRAAVADWHDDVGKVLSPSHGASAVASAIVAPATPVVAPLV